MSHHIRDCLVYLFDYSYCDPILKVLLHVACHFSTHELPPSHLDFSSFQNLNITIQIPSYLGDKLASGFVIINISKSNKEWVSWFHQEIIHINCMNVLYSPCLPIFQNQLIPLSKSLTYL